ncbi:Hypothetical predicted protein, partial [Marmota monax]
PQNNTQTPLAQTCCAKATCSASRAVHPGHPPLLASHWHGSGEFICEASLLELLPKPSSDIANQARVQEELPRPGKRATCSADG